MDAHPQGNAGNAQSKPCNKCGQRERVKNQRWCAPCRLKYKRDATLRTALVAEQPELRESGEARPAAIAGGSDALAEAGNVLQRRRETFARSDAEIPKRDPKLIGLAVLKDEGPTLYKQMVRGIRRSTRFSMEFWQEMNDRIHGKAKQHVLTDHRFRGAVFQRDAGAPAAESGAPAAEDAELVERVDLGMVPPAVAVPTPIPTQALVVLPPPREG